MRWGLDTEAVGLREFGATLDGDAALQLPVPEKQHLSNYARQVLVAPDEALSQVDDAEFQRGISYVGQPESVCYAITDQLKHLSRHLGMIEAMRGIQWLDDTATIQVGEINALPIQPRNRHLLHSEDHDVFFSMCRANLRAQFERKS